MVDVNYVGELASISANKDTDLEHTDSCSRLSREAGARCQIGRKNPEPVTKIRRRHSAPPGAKIREHLPGGGAETITPG